jgi:pilus assembly protein CpaB
MRNKTVRLVAAVLLATMGTLVLVRYVESARQRAVAAETLVDVLLVEQKIDKGTAAADIAKKVKKSEVPAKLKAADAVTNVDDLKDLHATADLLPGEQVVKARFANAGTATRGEAPKGLLQVTVRLESERALGGEVRPGDTVGVLLSFKPFSDDGGVKTGSTTHLELHKVLVTDVQIQSSGGGIGGSSDEKKEAKDGVNKAPSGTYLVTIALDAPAVEQVVFATEFGSIWLSAEPKDAPEGGTKAVGRSNVFTAGVQ